MTDYTPVTVFGDKDSLTASDPEKVIQGSDLDAELSLIQTAITSKYDSTDIASQAQAEAGTNNGVLMTPLRTAQAIAALGTSITKVKTGNTQKTSDTTLADDPHLAGWSLEASTRYMVHGILRVRIKAASDFKCKFDFTSAPTAAFLTFGVGFEAGTTATGDHQADETDTAIILSDSNVDGLTVVNGVVITNSAATVDFQWAQNVSVAENLLLLQGSFITFTKLD